MCIYVYFELGEDKDRHCVIESISIIFACWTKKKSKSIEKKRKNTVATNQIKKGMEQKTTETKKKGEKITDKRTVSQECSEYDECQWCHRNFEGENARRRNPSVHTWLPVTVDTVRVEATVGMYASTVGQRAGGEASTTSRCRHNKCADTVWVE